LVDSVENGEPAVTVIPMPSVKGANDGGSAILPATIQTAAVLGAVKARPGDFESDERLSDARP